MSLKIGVTGGIGSGKSVVCALFRLLGLPVYTADDEARRLMNEEEQIRLQLIELLGPSAYTREGLNRKVVADFLFRNPQNASLINQIVHPVVRADFQEWAARQADSPYLLLEAAILFEAGFDRSVDCTLLVDAPRQVRLARAMERDGAAREAIERRMAAQMDDARRRALADLVVLNDGIAPLIPQVLGLISSSFQNNNYLCRLKNKY